mmetsp:Transcript_3948/g.8612  ORF Transcript_3948/g.8612 Transcript_3948/m.8612 type:complete len:225 (-) Transcript_3948:111-785(-)
MTVICHGGSLNFFSPDPSSISTDSSTAAWYSFLMGQIARGSESTKYRRASVQRQPGRIHPTDTKGPNSLVPLATTRYSLWSFWFPDQRSVFTNTSWVLSLYVVFFGSTALSSSFISHPSPFVSLATKKESSPPFFSSVFFSLPVVFSVSLLLLLMFSNPNVVASPTTENLQSASMSFLKALRFGASALVASGTSVTGTQQPSHRSGTGEYFSFDFPIVTMPSQI